MNIQKKSHFWQFVKRTCFSLVISLGMLVRVKVIAAFLIPGQIAYFCMEIK